VDELILLGQFRGQIEGLAHRGLPIEVDGILPRILHIVLDAKAFSALSQHLDDSRGALVVGRVKISGADHFGAQLVVSGSSDIVIKTCTSQKPGPEGVLVALREDVPTAVKQLTAIAIHILDALIHHPGGVILVLAHVIWVPHLQMGHFEVGVVVVAQFHIVDEDAAIVVIGGFEGHSASHGTGIAGQAEAVAFPVAGERDIGGEAEKAGGIGRILQDAHLELRFILIAPGPPPHAEVPNWNRFINRRECQQHIVVAGTFKEDDVVGGAVAVFSLSLSNGVGFTCLHRDPAIRQVGWQV